MIRVVIADDEAPAREKLERWLSEQPDMAVVGSAEDGLSALQCIERFHPEVAFLDVQMPTLSGLQVAAQLEPSSAPLIVFVTAFDEHAVKAFDLNAIDYLLKPYDRDRLARTAQRVRERLNTHQPGAAAVAPGEADTRGSAPQPSREPAGAAGGAPPRRRSEKGTWTRFIALGAIVVILAYLYFRGRIG